MLENGYGESTLAEAFGGKTIVTEDLGYLPLSLPYQNADKAESDKVQFEYLNKLIGGEETGYTWHHTETPGKMELIPYGIHNMVAHNGGRSPGMWAYAKR
jgi:hypothetical protein